MDKQNDYRGMSKYQLYRKIRSDRAFRTLGRMNLYRVVAGILLLVLVFLISGSFSRLLAGRGSFKAAKALMIAPEWMEKYKPSEKAYIEAGVLFQAGEYADARRAFAAIDGYAAAEAMAEAAAVREASLALESAEHDRAYELITDVEPSVLPEAYLQEYRDARDVLLRYYAGFTDAESAERAGALEETGSDAAPK